MDRFECFFRAIQFCIEGTSTGLIVAGNFVSSPHLPLADDAAAIAMACVAHMPKIYIRGAACVVHSPPCGS